MKIALVHDYLNQYGGAERVLQEFLKIFPDAHLYTIFYSHKQLNGLFAPYIKKTSFLDFELARSRHRFFIPLMPAAVKNLKLKEAYDLVISGTAGFGKGIDANGAFHLSYCHTPLRYAWEADSYFENPFFKFISKPAFRYLRHWDFKAAQASNLILANSSFIAGKIKLYYKRDAEVVYPPVDQKKFYRDRNFKPRNAGPYYLAVGRLLRYKKFDLAIEAFSKLGLRLKIVGQGPEEKRLKALAAGFPNIEFLSFVSDEELRKLYQGAAALIFPQVEDFGLTAAEAQACGAPVVAFAAGGALEIVKDGITGVLFNEPTAAGLISAVERFQKLDLNSRAISKSASRFSSERFAEKIISFLPPKLSNLTKLAA